MTDIAVAYLARPAHGIEMFKSFLDAYSTFDAGVEHELIVIFKGFAEDGQELAEYRKLLGNLPHRPFLFPDVQFDLGAYRATARAFPFEFFCFLNSYSRPVDHGWLEKLHRHALHKDVGVVGATASYESLLDGWVNDEARSNRGLIGTVRSLIRCLPRRFTLRSRLERQWMSRFGAFKPFPNPTIRTNGFFIRRRDFLRLDFGKIDDKWDAFEFESGRRGMTNQILRMGLKALVAGRDGKSYEIDEWSESQTFRSGDQSNLLIADNHTRDFDKFDSEGRQYLTLLAWGDRTSRS
jgi:hypothetical protein